MSSILAIPGEPITQGQIEALVIAAKIKGYLSPSRVLTDKNWGALLTEIRFNICEQGKNTKVAGPWPVSGDSSTYGITGFNSNLNGPNQIGPVGGDTSEEINFYFAAASSSGHSISMVQRILGADFGADDNENRFDREVKIIVGGNLPVRFEGGFAFYAYQLSASSSIGATVNTDFPGLSFEVGPQTGFAGGAQSVISNQVDATLNPGVYTFNITISNAQGFAFAVVQGMASWLFRVGSGAAGFPRITTVVGTPVPHPGIHGSLNTFKIVALPAEPADPQNPDDPEDLLRGKGTGIYGYNRRAGGYSKGGAYYESTTPGLWCVKTRMIRGMKNLCAYMPWNPLITTGPQRGLPTGDEISERKYQPASGNLINRTNSTNVAGGDYIRENGAYFYALRNGVTASIKPQFGDGGVIDGSVSWVYMGDNLPVQSRIFASPCYPYYRLGESIANYPYWGAFTSPVTNPLFFIRNLRITRHRAETANQVDINGTSDPIPVQVGCIKNGSFYSFGTFNTGTLYTVFWPVFQVLPLVYSATESVSISAEVSTIVEEATSGEVDFPILADHFNETARTMGIAI